MQGNHLHLLVEADDQQALARAMQALQVRMARGLNRVMSRKGRVFDDRYHCHVLRTPTEVRHAIRYVRDNARQHAAERGETYSPGYIDPYSSQAEPTLVAEASNLAAHRRLATRLSLSAAARAPSSPRL